MTRIIKRLLYALESTLLIVAVIPVFLAMFGALMLTSLGDLTGMLVGDVAGWCLNRMEQLEDLKEELSD